MWNWIQGGFYIFLMVLEHYPKVWIVPCIFFLFCVGLIALLNGQLAHYFETRHVTQMSSFLDQVIVSIYDKIRGKMISRYLILGTLVLFVIGYLRARKKCYWSFIKPKKSQNLEDWDKFLLNITYCKRSRWSLRL